MVLKEMLLSSLTVALSELGDKSQFVSGFFATKINAILLAASLLIGLAAITYATIFIGRKFNKHIHEKVVHYVGGSVLILLGILVLVGVY